MHTNKNLTAMIAALNDARDTITAPVSVSISTGNVKMGRIPSVSLAPILTCHNCAGCSRSCYALKGLGCRSTVRNAYAKNTVMAECFPDSYWMQVSAAMSVSRFFRFHVAGDIPSRDYLSRMISAAAGNPHCQILCFTKCYDLVNAWIDEHWSIPENLHLIYSAWPGLEMENPYGLPVAHYIPKGEDPGDIPLCTDNCETCAAAGTGCWAMEPGDCVGFKHH